MRNLLLWFAHEFTQIRQNKKDILTFGLYPTWQRYIPHVAAYLRELSKCFVNKMTASLAEAASNEGKNNCLYTCVVLEIFFFTKLFQVTDIIKRSKVVTKVLT